MRLAFALILGYLLGSIPLAVWVGKATKGIDIREHGSGNAGATNAIRVLGPKPGLFVLILDMAKGLVAVLLVAKIAQPHVEVGSVLIGILTGSCAILGHIFPVALRFRGGKGVGTGAGVMFALTPVVTLCALLLWIVIVASTRYVSVASMTAAVSLPAMLILGKLFFGYEPGVELMCFSILLAAAVMLSHHANIKRLLAGTENRFTLSSVQSPR